MDIIISSFQGLGPDFFGCLFLGRRAMTNIDSVLKSRDITLLTKVHSQSYGFSSSHVQMWEFKDVRVFKEDWALKNWCFQTVVLEKTLESLLDCKFKPVNTKGNQLWIFKRRTDAEAETPILRPPEKSWLIWKDPDSGKAWKQEEKGMIKDEMVGWHHWLNGHGFEWTLELVIDREAWHAAVHGVSKSRTGLSEPTAAPVPGRQPLPAAVRPL